LLVHSIKGKNAERRDESRDEGTQTEERREQDVPELRAEQEVLYQTVPFRPH
jgi:hypothetical protein